MKYLLRFLLEPSMAHWKYCLCLAPLAIVPSVLLSILAILLADAVGVDVVAHSAPAMETTLSSFMGAVVYAPIVETLILSWLLKVLLSASRSPVESAVAAAGLWGLLHGIFGAFWFFGTVWSFFVFSCGYISWHHTSYWRGFLAASIPHALVNSTVLIFSFI